MRYIEYENAQIVWNEKYDKFKKKFILTDIAVYRFTKEDVKKYREDHREGNIEENEFYKYRKLSSSYGRDTSTWSESKDNRMRIVLYLIIECDDREMLKKCLHELGKIDEFEAVRLQYYEMFRDCVPDFGYKHFINCMYPEVY